MDGTLDAPGDPGSHESSAMHRAVHPEDSVDDSRGGERWYDPWPVKLMLLALGGVVTLGLTGGTWIVSSTVDNLSKNVEQDLRIKSQEEWKTELQKWMEKSDARQDQQRAILEDIRREVKK